MDADNGRLYRAVIALLLASGCGPGDLQPADIQLDILNAPLVDTDWIRVCIEDNRVMETPVGDGRIAIPGLPATGPIELRVHALHGEESTGKIQPTLLDENQPWKTSEWRSCSPPCTPCNIENSAPETATMKGRLLAIHFID